MKHFTVLSILAIIMVAVVLVLSIFGAGESVTTYGMVDEKYPGAMINAKGAPEVEKQKPIPALDDIEDDRPIVYEDGCHVKPGDSEVNVCEYGEISDYKHTVALIGSSKSAHWLPALESFADEEDVRILSATKSGCNFSLSEGQAEDCRQWNRDVVKEVMDKKPDLVVTLADTIHNPETVPDGYIKQFERFAIHDVQVLALRDTPYFEDEVAACLEVYGLNTDECNTDKKDQYPEVSAWSRLEDPPANVHYVDYTDYICKDDVCQPVLGNVVGFIDRSHMTSTFSATFGPILRRDVIELLESGA
ncbi:SGNH hydrolase domain-containing protein [Salinicoccus roseus]|uniref:SGNH hydrolase domain-containing protein n=1 Tax=Salinicoccus roseus TaxID=45670 RepID=UPI000F50B2F9|nr:SGNH hydrolase domain-containing protein [Salinicoccus roseus]RPE54798.1 hypothetical protein EDC33_1061 [Salinicoccus roseus]GGA62547.1 hypothetical protein GCM10007176_03720 [Salinicoccus roseus]